MKFILCLMLVILFTATAALPQDDSEEWVMVKKSKLMGLANLIADLRSAVNVYSTRVTVLELEVMRLENNYKMLEERYNRARKGLWAGVGSGFPLGAQGMTMYQFNERFGLFLIGGFNSIWSVNLGFMARVK